MIRTLFDGNHRAHPSRILSWGSPVLTSAGGPLALGVVATTSGAAAAGERPAVAGGREGWPAVAGGREGSPAVAGAGRAIGMAGGSD